MRLLTFLIFSLIAFPLFAQDEIQRTSQLQRVYFLDGQTRAYQTDTDHWFRTHVKNRTGNFGQQDTLKLYSLKNDYVSFQVICVAASDTVDSVEVWIDSLRHFSGTYTIKNDSLRNHKDPFNYTGRPIEFFVPFYEKVMDSDTISFGYNGIYNPGPAEVRTRPVVKGETPVWLVPSMVQGNKWYDGGGQGGYPFFVPKNRITGVWGDIYVSRSAANGYYYGRVRIVEGGQLSRSIPVQLLVYDFSLSDTVFTRAWHYIMPDIPVDYHGKTIYSSDFYRVLDNYARLARRHLQVLNFGIGHDGKFNRADSIRKNVMGYYTGYKFRAENRFDGLGQNLGWNIWNWCVYEPPKNSSSWTPSAWDYLGGTYNTDTEAGWRLGSDYLEDVFTDSTQDFNHSRVWRFMYGPDEVKSDVYTWIITRISWIKNNPGPGKALKWVNTLYGLSPELYPYMGQFMFANNPADTTYYHTQGYVECLTRPVGQINSYKMASQLRVLYPGMTIGWYNSGARYAQPLVTDDPMPFTESMVGWWVNYKYSVDAWFNWEAFQAQEGTRNLDRLRFYSAFSRPIHGGSWWNAIENCNDSWNQYTATNITANTSSLLPYTGPYGSYYQDSLLSDYSVCIAATGSVSAGVLATESRSAWGGTDIDSRKVTTGSVYFRSNRTFQPGQITILFDNTANCVSPEDSLQIDGYEVPNRWVPIRGMLARNKRNLPDFVLSQNFPLAISVGIRSNVSLSAGDSIWLDDIQLHWRTDLSTDPPRRGSDENDLQSTEIVPGEDPFWRGSRGIEGPIVRSMWKNMRRGQLDYQMFVHAKRYGINVDSMIDSVVGGCFTEMGNYRTGPFGPRIFAFPQNGWPYNHWNDPSQKQWRDSSYYYDDIRVALAESLVVRSGGQPPAQPYVPVRTTYYVKASGGSDSYNGLSPTYTSGITGPFATIAKAATIADTNDVVNVYTGKYTGKIVIYKQATEQYPRIFQAASAQLCTVQVSDTAWSINATKGVTITGFLIYNSRLPIAARSSKYIVFDGNTVKTTNAQTSAYYYHTGFWDCNKITIKNNTFQANATDSPQGEVSAYVGDGVTTRSGDSNYICDTVLVFNNFFSGFKHYPISMLQVRRGIILNNTIRWNHGGVGLGNGGSLYGKRGTGRNIVQFNNVSRTGMNPTSDKGCPYQIFSDTTVSRYNIAYNDTLIYSYGIAKTMATFAAQFDSGRTSLNNRAYGNVVWGKNKIEQYGESYRYKFIAGEEPGGAADDNILNGYTPLEYNHYKNNLFAWARTDSPVVYFEFTSTTYGITGAGVTVIPNGPKDVMTDFTHFYDGNMLWGTRADKAIRYNKVGTDYYYTVAQAISGNPTLWGSRNTFAYPTKLDTTNRTFTITDETSNLIDAGANLTTVTGSQYPGAPSSWITVSDVKWFFDGYGVIPADSIIIGSVRAKISSIDYNTNTIYLVTSVTVSVGASVNVLAAWNGYSYVNKFSGSYPDIGVHEYGAVTVNPPTGTFYGVVGGQNKTYIEIASPTSIQFVWTSSNATSATFESVPKAISHDTTFTISASKRYTIRFTNSSGYKEYYVDVNYGGTGVTSDNIFNNGSFERTGGWNFYSNGGSGNTFTRTTTSPRESTWAGVITFDAVLGTNTQLWSSNSQLITLTEGKQYHLIFSGISSSPKDSFAIRILNYTTYEVYNAPAPGWQKMIVNDSWTTNSYYFTAQNLGGGSTSNAYLQLMFYYAQVPYQHAAGATIKLDSIYIYEVGADTVALVSPENNAYVDLPVGLQWFSGPAIKYHLQVSTDPIFATSEYSQDTITTTYFELGEPTLAEDEIYFWRVKAFGSLGWSDWTSSRKFTTNIAGPTSAPTLLLPPNGSVGLAPQVSFSWTAVEGASQYVINVADDDAFSVNLLEDTSAVGGTTVVEDLEYQKTKYWRVKAINAYGSSSWSSTWSFLTGSRAGLAPRRVTKYIR